MTATLGIDLGTSGARAVVIDTAGVVVAEAEASYPLLTPRPGWAEQRPEEWWISVCDVARRVAGASRVPIEAIGLTGQMHGSVFLDSAGASIRPALTWNDQRTVEQADRIADLIGPDRLVRITGNVALTGFQAPKVVWLRDHEPDAYRRIAHVLLPKDFIRYRLTGDLATDPSDASGTLLLDLRHREWSADVADALGIPREWLPRIVESPATTGVLMASVAAELGLRPGMPVAAGASDNAAAAIGSGIVRPGLVSSSIGTSGVLFAHVDAATSDPTGRVHAFCHAIPSAYSLLGVTLSAGGSLGWWSDVMGASLDQLVREAAATTPGAEGLLFLPYLIGERTPHLDPAARGAFVGLTIRHTRGHLTRAVMEGVVLSLRAAATVMRAAGVEIEELRATGGGAEVPLWRRLQADILGLPIRRVVGAQGAAYGAALIARVAAGHATDLEIAIAGVRLSDEMDVPDASLAGRYDDLFGIYESLYGATAAAMHGLGAVARADDRKT